MNLLLLLFFSDKDQSLTLSLCVLLSVTEVWHLTQISWVNAQKKLIHLSLKRQDGERKFLPLEGCKL